MVIATLLLASQLAGPVLKPRDAQCPRSYRASGDYCVPNGNNATRAAPKPRGAQCPGGAGGLRAIFASSDEVRRVARSVCTESRFAIRVSALFRGRSRH